MDGGVYKAEFVYIRDPEENEPVDIPQEKTHAKKVSFYPIKSDFLPKTRYYRLVVSVFGE